MKRYWIGVLALCFAVNASAVFDGEMELGIGLGGQYIHDYRGSKETQIQFLPFPFVKYHGDFLKIDRKGVEGEIYASDRFEFNLSADLALNGDSHDNRLRAGMPELASAAQMGPSFNINITGKNFHTGWAARLPLRGVVAIDTSKVEYIGYNFAPKLTYQWPNFYGEWDAKADVGVIYASEKYHRYYYSVEDAFATVERPAYAATAGYSGAFVKVGAKARYGNIIYGTSIRYDNLEGVVFEDSPLMETTDHWVVSAGVAWVFYKRN
ncbi:MipA/OmpV family protein [Saccharophagus degradans]|uniref:MipA/OmpV family protein n=1 Tax=Saccharophagus degradans TaxID=86304 RepID=UPI001C098A49|nr:MipA/OmpV family protein [Saccharophagus degradans]